MQLRRLRRGNRTDRFQRLRRSPVSRRENGREEGAGERPGRLHHVRMAAAVEVGHRGSLLVDDPEKDAREAGHDMNRPCLSVARQGDEARLQARLDDDHLVAPIAVQVGGRQVGVDPAQAPLAVGGPAPQQTPVTGVRTHRPIGHGAHHLRTSVPVQVGHQDTRGRAGEVVAVRGAELDRPPLDGAAVRVEGEEEAPAGVRPGDDAGDDFLCANAVQVADAGGSVRVGGLRQRVGDAVAVEVGPKEDVWPPGRLGPVAADHVEDPRRQRQDQVDVPVVLQVGGEHFPLPRPVVGGAVERYREPGERGRGLRDLSGKRAPRLGGGRRRCHGEDQGQRNPHDGGEGRGRARCGPMRRRLGHR